MIIHHLHDANTNATHILYTTLCQFLSFSHVSYFFGDISSLHSSSPLLLSILLLYIARLLANIVCRSRGGEVGREEEDDEEEDNALRECRFACLISFSFL